MFKELLKNEVTLSKLKILEETFLGFLDRISYSLENNENIYRGYEADKYKDLILKQVTEIKENHSENIKNNNDLNNLNNILLFSLFGYSTLVKYIDSEKSLLGIYYGDEKLSKIISNNGKIQNLLDSFTLELKENQVKSSYLIQEEFLICSMNITFSPMIFIKLVKNLLTLALTYKNIMKFLEFLKNTIAVIK